MHTQILYEGAKELAQVEPDSSKYVLSPDNQVCTLAFRN
jgi:guanine nucleotide-binding protein G(t) subunit alpha 3